MYKKILKITLERFQNKATSRWGYATCKSWNGKMLNPLLFKNKSQDLIKMILEQFAHIVLLYLQHGHSQNNVTEFCRIILFQNQNNTMLIWLV